MITVHWVGQEDRCGCVIACLAMLTGRTYKDVRDSLPCWKGDGLDFMVADRFLANNGYAVARKWNHDCVTGERHPPQPFGEVHLAQVTTFGNTAHEVIVLADGVVFDPSTPEPRRLTDYAKVDYVAAIVRIGKGLSRAE